MPLEGVLQFGLEPLELFGAQRAAVFTVIDQRAAGPRRIGEQRAVPFARRIVHCHRGGGSGKTACAVMVVGRVEAAQVDDVGPAVLVLQRDRQRAIGEHIAIGGRPAIFARDHLHALGPERIQLDRHARAILDQLDIGIAVKRQLRGEHFEQRLRPAGFGEQLGQPRIIAGDRRTADPLGDDPHAALRDRIGEIGLGHLARIIEGTAPQRPAIESGRPGADEAARNGHARSAPALEGGDEAGEEGHGFLQLKCRWEARPRTGVRGNGNSGTCSSIRRPGLDPGRCCLLEWLHGSRTARWLGLHHG